VTIYTEKTIKRVPAPYPKLDELVIDSVKSLSPYDLESLYNAGVLSIDDVAKYVNSVGSVDMWAHIFYEHFTTGFVYSIISNANISGDRVQSILYKIPYSLKLVDIITYNAPNASFSSSTTISGVNRYRDVTVGGGVTLSVDGQPGVIICRSLSNSGTIDKTLTGASGGDPTPGGGAGGRGGGGLLIFTYSLVNTGVIRANGGGGGNGTRSTAFANGVAGGAGAFYLAYTDNPGSGGDGGLGGTGGAPGWGGVNGGGGGGGQGRSGGSGDGSTVTRVSDYITMVNELKMMLIDWFIVNVLGKTLTTRKSFPNPYGSGGGSGGAYTNYYGGGGGGGGGGEVIVVTNDIYHSGTTEANGGGGGGGGGTTYDLGGGGGGGGGVVYVFYSRGIITGTIQAVGGAGGYAYAGSGSPGTSGTAKAIQITYI